MIPFSVLQAPAVALARDNLDTDQIIPARFLRKPRIGASGGGYGGYLFADLRLAERDFPLDRPAAAGAAILLAGANFGGGSSREGAVYALMDAGFRCVIAAGFGDIFAGNAVQNGLLTIILPPQTIADLALGLATPATLRIDLPGQTITLPNGAVLPFAIDAFRKTRLVQGLDEIGLTLQQADAIAAWRDAYAAHAPWAAQPLGVAQPSG